MTKEQAKASVMKKMYASVERMNECFLVGNKKDALEEMCVQMSLRAEFEKLD